MPAASRPSFPLPTWLLAGALLLSLGANLYWLTPGYHSERPEAAATSPRAAWDDDDEEEDDASWAALTEELRRARHQLAECQAGQIPAQDAPPAFDR